MKNIYVLPTDKPSRLIKQTNGKLRLSDVIFRGQVASGVTQNIYITSNEEIKEGDWFIRLFDNIIFKANPNSDHKLYECKKIILTTDQDLIKNGVQEITDEFLEWFVKNPSCEFVEVTEYLDGGFSYGYKIIIPKEEHLHKGKVLTSEEVAIKLEEIEREEREQETLEEESPMNNLLKDLKQTKISVKESIDTIKDEFMRYQINIFVQKTLDAVIYRIENELLEIESKWQQQQRYSEEEVELIANEMVNWAIDNIGNQNPQSGKKFDEVIAKFKKK